MCTSCIEIYFSVCQRFRDILYVCNKLVKSLMCDRGLSDKTLQQFSAGCFMASTMVLKKTIWMQNAEMTLYMVH